MKEQELSNVKVSGGILSPALCLDLDGTVRRSKSDHKGFIKDLEDMELMPGIEEIIWEYRKRGYIIFGVSNQGGVAHGHTRPSKVLDGIDHMVSLFKQNPFHSIKTSFHMPDGTVEPYNHRSLCRKPDIGMLVVMEGEAWLMANTIVDWDNSLMVGDREEDEQLAKNARIAFMHIDQFLTARVSVPEDLPQSPGPKSTIPTTIEEALKWVSARMNSIETTPEFKDGKDRFSAFCHSQLSGGIGMQIRNGLGLWSEQNPPLIAAFHALNLMHPDDMSNYLIEAWYDLQNTNNGI